MYREFLENEFTNDTGIFQQFIFFIHFSELRLNNPSTPEVFRINMIFRVSMLFYDIKRNFKR